MAGNFLELGTRLGEPLVVFGLHFWARGSRLPGRSKFRTLAMVEHMEEESPNQGDRRIDAFAFVLRIRDFGKEIGGPQTARTALQSAGKVRKKRGLKRHLSQTQCVARGCTRVGLSWLAMNEVLIVPPIIQSPR